MLSEDQNKTQNVPPAIQGAQGQTGEVPENLEPILAHPIQRALARGISDVLRADSLTISRRFQVSTFLAISKLAGIIPGIGSSSPVANVTHVGEDLAPLHLLAARDKEDCLAIAQDLLDAGAEVNAAGVLRNEAGEELRSQVSPLHLSVLSRNVPYVDWLLNHRASTALHDSLGQTAFRALFEDFKLERDLSLADQLLNHHSDIEALDSQGTTALSSSICSGNWEAAWYLLERGATLKSISAEEWKRVSAAIVNQLYALADQKEWSGLERLCDILQQKREVWGTQALMDWVNTRETSFNPTLLHVCLGANAPVAVVQRVLECGADVSAECSYIFLTHIGRELRGNVTPLHIAAHHHRAEVIQLLAESGGDVRAVDSEGETPLFMIVRHARGISNEKGEPGLEAFVALLEGRAAVNAVNYSGRTCSDLCLLSSFWRHLGELGQRGGDVHTITDEELEQVESALRNQIHQLVISRNWDRVQGIFEALGNVGSFKDSAFIPNVLNASDSSGRNSATFSLCRFGATSALLSLVRDLGADFTEQGSVTLPKVELPVIPNESDAVEYLLPRWKSATEIEAFPGVNARASKVSMVHAAASSGSLETLRWLLAEGYAVDDRDSFGNPASFYAATSSSAAARADCLELLFKAGLSPWAANLKGVTLYDLAAVRHDTFLLHTLNPNILALKPEDPALVRSWYSTAKDFDIAHVRALQSGFIDELVVAKPEIAAEALGLLRSNRNLELAYDYLKGLNEALSRNLNGDGKHLAKIMPAIFGGDLPRHVLGVLAHHIEYHRPLAGQIQLNGGFHPNLAELMACLRNAKDPTGKDRFLGVITSSLTSTVQLWRHMQSVDGRLAEMWAKLGMMGYSFPFFKHDSRHLEFEKEGTHTVLPSLLEQYGLTLNLTERDGELIKQFILRGSVHALEYYSGAQNEKSKARRLDERTLIIQERGYYLVSHPDYGTLIKRNDSPVFGRDKLRFPVYWSFGGVGNAFTEDFLLNLDRQQIDLHFHHILDPNINKNTMRLVNAVTHLLDEFQGFCEHYAAWKYDTRKNKAWMFMDGLPPILQGGHFSRGFIHVVHYLETLASLGKKLPDLAFVHPDYSPWNRFSYEHRGTRSTLTITPEVLSILGKLARGEDLLQGEMKRTGVHEFFQQAGMAHAGSQLLLVDRAD